MNKVKAFFQDYSDELLNKVQWPTLPELQSSTVTVLIASVIIALIIAIMDMGFSNVMKFMYSIF